MAQTPEKLPSDGAASDTRRGPLGRLRVGGLPPSRDPRNPKAWLAAIGVHIVFGVVLVRMVSLGHGLHDWFGLAADTEKREERVTFVETPKPVTPPPAQKRPVEAQRAPASLSVPTIGPVAPAAEPARPATTSARSDSGSGGGGTPGGLPVDPRLRGIVPAAGNNPAIWAPAGQGTGAPRTAQDLMDSVVGQIITQARDSVDSIANLHRPSRGGDWTKTTKNGEKWGWDQAGVRLGKVIIPNALLGFLSGGAAASFSSNPTEYARGARLAMARADIQRFSQGAVGDAEFRKAVEQLRERKEREHQEQMKAKASDQSKTPPPKAGSGNE